jgi:hypothetical protein
MVMLPKFVLPSSAVVEVSDIASHSMILGTTGKGRSFVSEQFLAKARREGAFVIDTTSFHDKGGKGLLPYEFEASRRLALGLSGRNPRPLQRRRKTYVVTDGCRPRGKKRTKDAHSITTANGVVLTRSLVRSAVDAVCMQTNMELKQPQMIGLLERSGIDARIAEFGEVETQIREELSSALAIELTGRRVPTYGDTIVDRAVFWAEFEKAAKVAGYQV